MYEHSQVQGQVFQEVTASHPSHQGWVCALKGKEAWVSADLLEGQVFYPLLLDYTEVLFSSYRQFLFQKNTHSLIDMEG